MANQAQSETKLAKMMGLNGLILAGFAVLCVGLIAMTYYITRDTIANEMKEALARTLNQLVSTELYDNDVHKDCTIMPASQLLGTQEAFKVYRMRKAEQPIAVVLESNALNGYSGKIKMVIGIFNDGSVAGVRITSHKETPGLGDKIELRKSDWVLSFNGKSLSEPSIEQWKVKKDGGQFDAFTGATITPRAVVQQVSNSLVYFEKNKDLLFNQQQNCKQTMDVEKGNDD